MKYLANKKTKQIFNGHIPRYDKDEIVTDGKPVKTGRIIDGKEEYVKRINFGSLPNNSYKDVPTGLDNVTFEYVKGRAYSTVTGNVFPIPYAAGENANISLCWVKATNSVRIQTWSDRSTIYAHVYIYFTYND